MTTVIGVRFRTAGKVYFFAPGKYDIHKGDHVVVETARGIEYGTVAGDPQDIEDDKVGYYCGDGLNELLSLFKDDNKQDFRVLGVSCYSSKVWNI